MYKINGKKSDYGMHCVSLFGVIFDPPSKDLIEAVDEKIMILKVNTKRALYAYYYAVRAAFECQIGIHSANLIFEKPVLGFGF